MNFKSVLTFVILGAATSIAAPPQGFPSDIQEGILNIQNYINGVINDIVQSSDNLALDYSSTGRSIAFLERDILPKNCPVNLPTSPTTQNSAIAALQETQLMLSSLVLDALDNNFSKGKMEICKIINKYESVAAYIQMVRTD